jgi:hypothetical protein
MWTRRVERFFLGLIGFGFGPSFRVIVSLRLSSNFAMADSTDPVFWALGTGQSL